MCCCEIVPVFLYRVLGRLVSLLSKQAGCETDNEALTKQAEGAAAQAQKLLDQSKVGI